MTSVGLFASFPHGERAEAARPFSLPDIGVAATAAIEATLRSGATLVFGGHPTISPLVLQVAHLLGAGDRVRIYQSEYYADEITEEVRALSESEGAVSVFTPAADSKKESLEIMRRSMVAEVGVGFFVGGMSGIREEMDLLRESSPNSRCFAFTTPGGVARQLVSWSLDAEVLANGVQEVRPVDDRLWALIGRGYGALSLHALERGGVSSS
jgi:hypothetical protein